MKIHFFPTLLGAILQLLPLASLAAALIVPENLPDGFYIASLEPSTGDKPDSTFKLVKSYDQILAEAEPSALAKMKESTGTATSLRRRSIIHRRGTPECNPEGRDLDWDEISVAIYIAATSMGWRYGELVDDRGAAFLKYKGVVLYMCCYNERGCVAWGEEMASEDKTMTASCGRTRVAHSHDHWIHKAYGRDSPGHLVCGEQYPTRKLNGLGAR